MNFSDSVTPSILRFPTNFLKKWFGFCIDIAGLASSNVMKVQGYENANLSFSLLNNTNRD